MAKKTTPVRGRPKKQPGEARSLLFQIRMTADEKRQVEQAAQAVGLDASAWARMHLLALSRTAPTDAHT